MILPTQNEVDEFLYQSNLIEGVDDPRMLADSILAWEYLMSRDVLTVRDILKVHKIAMRNSDLLPNERGYFRTIDVWVGNHKGADPREVPSLMLMQFCFNTLRAYPPPDWKELHVLFEKIHPFVDGNGRVGRMLMNWTRIKRCELPLLTIYAAERQAYYAWFR